MKKESREADHIALHRFCEAGQHQRNEGGNSMKFREDVSIDIDSASGCVNASLEIKYFGFWSGLFGGTPFKTERWTFMEDELVPVDALNLVCARLMRAGVRETTIEELRKNATSHKHLYRA